MRTLHLKAMLNEYLYLVRNNIVTSWIEYKRTNKRLKHFKSYIDLVLFIQRLEAVHVIR